MLFRERHFAMQIEQPGYGFGRTPSEAAFGGDAEVANDFLCCGQSAPGAGDAIGAMHQSEVEFGPASEPQVF